MTAVNEERRRETAESGTYENCGKLREVKTWRFKQYCAMQVFFFEMGKKNHERKKELVLHNFFH